jgi:phosphopantetheinyl transferase
MPIFFQHQINEATRLGIWKIEETEEFFLSNVPLQKEVTHPHKRLQHLAGRFLLQFLFPDFPYELIRIADTNKPYLQNEKFHFSISHSGDYAAVIVSKNQRVGLDIEILSRKAEKIKHKFLSEEEMKTFYISKNQSASQLSTLNSQLPTSNSQLLTLLWCAKESVFKWYGDGGVDFRKDIQLKKQHQSSETIDCFFVKNNQQITNHYKEFEHLVLVWVIT